MLTITVVMGNCLTKTTQDADGLVVDVRKRSFSKRIDMWEKTGTVAFRSSSLKVCCRFVEIVSNGA